MRIKRSKGGVIKMTAENKQDSLTLLKFLENAAGHGNDPDRPSLVRERRLAIEEQYNGVFTKEFWLWSSALPNMLNLLIQDENLFIGFDMYSSGEFLSMDVLLTRTKKHLKLLIKNINEYRNLNNAMFNHDPDPNILGLSKLVHVHREYFGSNKAVMWDATGRRFLSAEELAVINEYGPFACDREEN